LMTSCNRLITIDRQRLFIKIGELPRPKSLHFDQTRKNSGCISRKLQNYTSR
jgi:hypothetical protein